MSSQDKKTFSMRRRDFLGGATAMAAFSIVMPRSGKAADKWPDKPITLVIMYAAGGGTDIIMRLLAKEMAAAKGWTIQPINKPGAVGGIATNYVLHEPADGYTLLGAANFNKFVRVMGHTASKQWEDWTTMQAAAAPASWSVRAASPLKSVDDVVKFAKANPGKLTISTSGTGGIWPGAHRTDPRRQDDQPVPVRHPRHQARRRQGAAFDRQSGAGDQADPAGRLHL
jgi:tripartite-type tricarboxylate transporter receptor subunit TctC